jgi:hypothetical protein
VSDTQGIGNSVWLANAFGATPSQRSRSNTITTLAPGAYDTYAKTMALTGGDPSGTLVDWGPEAGTSSNTVQLMPLVVNPSDVGNVLQYRIDVREYGMTMDEFIFSTNSNLPAPTPEPGSLVLVVTALAGLLGYAWRKRR